MCREVGNPGACGEEGNPEIISSDEAEKKNIREAVCAVVCAPAPVEMNIPLAEKNPDL